jgi:hypothetical protein
MAIRWGFWMSLLTFIRAILAQVGLYLKRWALLWCSYVLFAANISASIILLMFMQVWRWSHAGKVCSGDYLDNLDDADKDVYLVFEGKFIKSILIVIYCILGISFLSVGIIACCVHKRNKAEERVIVSNGNVFTKRQSAFSKALDPDYEAAMLDTGRSTIKKISFDTEAQTDGEKSSLLKA